LCVVEMALNVVYNKGVFFKVIMSIQSIGNLVTQITHPLFRNKPHMALMAHWTMIVGADLAKNTWPLKIVSTHTKDVTLYVGVKAAYALNAWSHSATVIQRVNHFFGHDAVNRIRFVKKPLLGPGATVSFEK
jgi:hypothetical protein